MYIMALVTGRGATFVDETACASIVVPPLVLTLAPWTLRLVLVHAARLTGQWHPRLGGTR